MKNAFRFYFTLCALLLAKTISAQQYFFTNYTTSDGLSNPGVLNMVKDHEGFLWIGTEAGLNRFNGYDFTVYKSLASDSTTIPSNAIFNLYVDRAGNLWVATSLGLCRYEKKHNRFKRLYCRMPNGEKVYSADCLSFVEDSKDNLWTTCISLGLLKYNRQDDCFEKFFPSANQPNKSGMSSMTEDADGTFWLATHKYLYHFNPSDNSFRELENKLHLEGNYIFQGGKIIKDPFDKNSLWLGTWGAGLVQFNKNTGEFISYKFQQDASRNLANIVFDIHEHEKNTWWLATNTGIISFDPVKKIFGSALRDSINEKSLVNNPHGIYRDDDGIIWIACAGGLCNIHPAKQNFINQPLWFNTPVQKCYYDEAAEKIYGVRYYSNRSLIIYDRKSNTTQTFKIPDADELRAEPFSVLKDDDGLIWIGTTRGIYSFSEKEKSFSLFETAKTLGIPERSIYAGNSFKDSSGNLWFSCYGRGLLMLDRKNKTIKTFWHDVKDKTSFPLLSINRITEGADKILYACDDIKGIVLIDSAKGVIKYLNPLEKKYAALARNTDMALDKEQQIWVTTKNNGLVCIDKNQEVTAYVKDDFGNLVDEQQGIAIDKSGKIWLAASTGIFRFEPASKSFTQFNLKDGFPAGTLSDAPALLNNGKIAYTYYKGIFCFDPSEVVHAGKPLNVHLTSLTINGKISEFSNAIDNIDTINLSHTENNLTLEFAATNFFNASASVYTYMLDGIDKNWSSPTRTRTINFSQLSPGDYTLRIKAGENSPEKKLFIQIIPAWWQTAWFKWLVALSIVAILFYSIRFYLSIRYRQRIAQLERQREIEGIRMRISRDIHDEIGSGLTKIKLMSRNLSRTATDVDAMKEATVKISSASDELIQNLSEIVWTVNPANDSLENVFAFTRNYLSKLFDENPDVKLTLDFPEPEKIPQGISLNPEVKRNLLLILKEAMTNTFKHAHASEVKVALKADKSKIEMSIKDNGQGISAESENSFGNGLKNMRKRAESINAQFNIESITERGTEIHVLIPLGKL